MTSLFAEREFFPKWREGEIFLFIIHEMRVEEKNDDLKNEKFFGS
jgi:hypothetical protein